ncbi:MAG: class C sortase [Coriobacteriia bacterium]|nr:class C sortase [Coriobacteriia bacterium]
MRTKISTVFAALLLGIGVLLLCYPFISNIVIQALQEQVAKEQIIAAQSLGEDEASAELARCRTFNKALHDGMVRVSDPFDPETFSTDVADYKDLLNISGDEVMGSVEIPSIRSVVPIYHGVSEAALEQGAGHLPTTSLPVGGKSTHCVLAGHTGLPSVRIFDDIEKLRSGDYIFIDVLGKRNAYKVTSTEVVLPEQTESLLIKGGQDLLTLVTCTPYGVNSHRLLVHAKRCKVPADAAVPSAIAETIHIPGWVWPAIGLVIFLLIVLAILRRVLGGQKPRKSAKHSKDEV